MGERRRLVLPIFLLWLASECSWAQAPARFAISQVSAQPPGVTVYLDVVDENGEPIARLPPSELTASIGGQAVKVSSVEPFDASGEGVAYIFLVDVSKSIKSSQFTQIRQALGAWIDGLTNADRMAIYTFGSQYKMLVGFTGDKASLTNALKDLKPTDPQTKLYLALNNAMNRSRQTTAGLPNRRVIVIMTDGKDEGSGITEDDVVRLIPQSHIPIYAIGYSTLPAQQKQQYLQVLNRFATLSGGLYSVAASPASFKTAYAEMESAIRRLFVVRLECAGCRTDSQLHPLEMTLTIGTGSNTVTRNSTLEANVAPPAVAAPTPGPGPTPTPPSPSEWWKLILSWQGIVTLVVVFSITFVVIIRVQLKKRGSKAQVSVEPSPVVEDYGTGPTPAPTPTPVSPAGAFRLQLTVVAGKERGRVDYINLVERSVVGRDRGCDAAFPEDTEMSGRHFELLLAGRYVEVRDLGSTNGTLLNGAELATSHRLEDGDLVRAGRTELRINIGGGT